MDKTDRNWYMNAGTKNALFHTYLKVHEIMENYNIQHNESNAFAALERWLANKIEQFGIPAEDIKKLTEGTYD